MADFATWICAAAPALGWTEVTFLQAYKRNREYLTAQGLEASPLFEPIVRIAKGGPWQGTPTELLGRLINEQLNDPVGVQRERAYPKTPRQLSQALRRLEPSLAEVGIRIAFSRTAGTNSARIISICDAGDAATQPV